LIADGEGYARRKGEKTTAAKIDIEGEVLVRAAGLLSAYLPVGLYSGEKMDMSVTEDALTADGWFRTGDVGALNADGRLRITDRLKELIKVRAYQVAPAELEAVLCSSEAVADAGVIGIYDKSEATEWPRAFVVPRAGKNNMSRAELEKLAGQLKTLVEGRTAKYKWLMGGIVFVDQIPKSPSGKILRRVLKNGGDETKGIEVKLYEKKRRDAKL
jgi:acyl-coenzyme A synthetase/AMP-(fatty) acid ligase